MSAKITCFNKTALNYLRQFFYENIDSKAHPGIDHIKTRNI